MRGIFPGHTARQLKDDTRRELRPHRDLLKLQAGLSPCMQICVVRACCVLDFYELFGELEDAGWTPANGTQPVRRQHSLPYMSSEHHMASLIATLNYQMILGMKKVPLSMRIAKDTQMHRSSRPVATLMCLVAEDACSTSGRHAINRSPGAARHDSYVCTACQALLLHACAAHVLPGTRGCAACCAHDIDDRDEDPACGPPCNGIQDIIFTGAACGATGLSHGQAWNRGPQTWMRSAGALRRSSAATPSPLSCTTCTGSNDCLVMRSSSHTLDHRSSPHNASLAVGQPISSAASRRTWLGRRDFIAWLWAFPSVATCSVALDNRRCSWVNALAWNVRNVGLRVASKHALSVLRLLSYGHAV
ncbi:hypothetical protein GGX14DRAFT_575511 [Mycena pura]|uniref:Uncharacterized protein n=1 Tax=Mycena pura TaxID=153505 RepID=A0AAD6V256_9AGAR|nr:hypothetical protein GGX14DRAFT_575511 [Mycena pura]